MYFEPANFGFIAPLVERWELFRNEYLALDAQRLDIYRVGPVERFLGQLLKNNGWTKSWQVDSSEPNETWLTYGLSYKSMVPDHAEEKLPVLSHILTHLRGCEIAAFSLMKPGSFIRPHVHPELAGRLLTLHIGLDVVPHRSYLCVDGVAREERNGHPIVFNSACEHFAVNMSDSDRVILYMEFDPRQTRFVE
jgi:beta-hydroxylase